MNPLASRRLPRSLPRSESLSYGALLALAIACAGAVATARPRQATGGLDYCPMALETVSRILGPFTDNYTTLEEKCVRGVATVGGITYAEAVGFDPMPSETITCRGHDWVVTIGQAPPRAPSEGVVLVGYERDHHGVRKFSARVERSTWRKQPNRIAVNGCGTVEGTVERQGDKWVAKTAPQKLGW